LFGDISKISLPETLNSPIRLSYARAVNKVHPDCYSCEWLNSCHNGCSHHRTGGLSGKYYYCKARKIIFAYLKSVVEKHLK
jgi:radical SAM protein with 4Fe4S-binding SPASM domain